VGDKVSEAIVDFANAVEAACVQLKRYIGEFKGVGAKEESFTCLLGWKQSQGNRLGAFDFTTQKANNNSDAFNRAYNILKVNNASISNRFHDKGWKYSYWVYSEKPDVIYRQVLKK